MSDINDLEYNYLDEQGLTKLVGNLNNKFKPTIRACYEEATALYPHEVGDYIWLETDETVYLVTDAISVGDSIVYETNITDSDLAENSIVGIQNKPGSGGEGGSGGHTIIDASGNEMPAESKLQFGEGFSVSNDSTNGKTIVTLNNNLLKFNGVHIFSISGDGVKTVSTLLNAVYAEYIAYLATKSSNYMHTLKEINIQGFSQPSSPQRNALQRNAIPLMFSYIDTTSVALIIHSCTAVSSGSTLYRYVIGTGGVSSDNYSDRVVPANMAVVLVIYEYELM